ncbi:oxidoreductase [Flammeovirgaceae bacterium SG7u.111]|nr:oxidoreductase [Flammeovirgaceae bacterium SG7u.132]WPO35141.1 oxidoreductase [Flammeovirgaceae bacterium SG7u.111]
MSKIKISLLLALTFQSLLLFGQTISWEIQDSGNKASIRGISAVNKKVCWLSGSGGTVAKTVDGGKTWVNLKVPNADSLDFRDIEAFSAKEAIIMSVGNGANSRIMKTVDGGATWKEVFVNKEAEGFFDGIAFWDKKHGILMGDPINGKLYILKTDDAGETWTQVPEKDAPAVAEGEFAFAASGSHIAVFGESQAWIGTGGSKARVFYSTDGGLTWNVTPTEIIQGESSTGLFSVDFKSATYGVGVGGDYTKEKEGKDNITLTTDGGKSWELVKDAGVNYCSSVRFVGDYVIATGPETSYYSADAGKTWTQFSEVGYHTLSIGNSPKAVWAAGRDGKVGKLIIK